MILLPISVLTLSCFAGKAFTEILHCYECDDCKASNFSVLRECPNTMSTIIPVNLKPDTTIPTIMATTTVETTTLPPTLSAEATTVAAAVEIVDATVRTVESVITTAPVPVSSPTESAADVIATNVATTTVASTVDEVNEDETEKVRKRSVRQVSYGTPILRRFARDAEVSHHCFSIKGYGGDKKKVKKGCVEVVGDKNPCDVLKEQYNAPLKGCRACNKNKCNNGASGNLYFMSMPLLLLVFVLLIENTN